MSTKEATRERLLEAAEKVFAEKGYYEAAVDEIVQESSTSKGSVYFHFPNKESLFLAVMDHLGNRLIRKVEQQVGEVTDPSQRLDVALTTTLETLTKHRTIAKLLLSKGAGMGPAFSRNRTEVFARFVALITGLLDDALPSRTAADLDREVVAYAWLGAISEVVERWLETGHPRPVREALPTLRRLLLNSVGPGLVEPRRVARKVGGHGAGTNQAHYFAGGDALHRQIPGPHLGEGAGLGAALL